MAKTLTVVTATVMNLEGEAMSYTAFTELGEDPKTVDELTEEAREQAFEDFEQQYYGAAFCFVNVNKLNVPDTPTATATAEANLADGDATVETTVTQK